MNKLVNNIWSFVNEVRGHKSITELKEIIVSLIFLKHANDEYLSNPFSRISIPEKSLYTFLLENLNSLDFLNILWDAFYAIENENDELRGTLTAFDFQRILRNRENLELVRNLFVKISEFALLKGDSSFSNFIGELLSEFADYEGMKGGDVTTPDSVSKLIVQLLNPKEGSVLDSACGTSGFFEQIKVNNPKGIYQFYGQEYNQRTLALAKLRFAFNTKANRINFTEANDTLVQDGFPDIKVDYVLMHPPFNVKYRANELPHNDPRFKLGIPVRSNANMAWLQHALYHLNENGKAAIVLSNNSLFSGGRDAEIRKKMIDSDLIESIIALPSGMLSNTSIPCCIWVFNKKKTIKNEILFIDFTNFGHKEKRNSLKVFDEKTLKQISTIFNQIHNNKLFFTSHLGFYKKVNQKEIIENDYLLSPSRYVGFEGEIKEDLSKAVPLRTVLEYVKPPKLDENVEYRKLSIKDLSSNSINYILDIDKLSFGELKSNYKVLPNNVLLIPRLGNTMKFSYNSQATTKIAFSANTIFTFRVDTTKVSIDYLIGELFKVYYHIQFSAFKFGAGIQLIRLKDLLNIKILIPSLEEQNKIVEYERERQFQLATKDLGFEKEIAKLKEAQMKDLGSKKHNIMQHLNNVKASTDVLTTMMELNNGILKSDEVIDPRRGVTVEKRFQRLQESLGKVIYYVDNITNELKYDPTKIIDSVKLIGECKERGLQNDLFSVEIIFEKATFQKQKPLISISKNDFEEIYNNIIENAMNHGFVDKSKSYIFRISIAYINNFLEINFVNNGKPFPKGIAEKILVKGEKAGKTGGTGIGLWKVAEIAKHFNCNLEVMDEPESEFPVGFKFQFKLETL